LLYNFSEEQLRSICRTSLEALEKWARLVVHKKMTEKYGLNYFNSSTSSNNPLIKKEIRDKSEEMMNDNPIRFKRAVDTLFLDEIIYILCKNEIYKNCFKEFLDIIYPDGNNEARTFLSRLIPIRNKLSHSNAFSIREAEQCICYCNDFIEGVKQYFKNIGDERMYNVPNAIKLNDSLGNEYYLNKDISFECFDIVDESTKKLHQFEIGDNYSIWLTLDPSFSEDEYTFNWHIESGKKMGNNSRLEIIITDEFIRERLSIYCEIVSKKSWHRYSGYDQQFAITFQVLPPIE